MFYQYVHNLRGLAILLVVLSHVVAVVPFERSQLSYLLFSLILNCTVIFVLIGGWLFTYLASKYNYKSYLKNKIKKVIFPYIIISIPALFIYVLGFKNTHSWVELDVLREQGIIKQIVFFITTGSHLGPLWFIPMIVIFYIMFPVFKILSDSRYLTTALVFSFIPALYFGRPEDNNNTIQSFFYFLPVWLSGMTLFRYSQIYKKLSSYFSFYLSMFLVFILASYTIWGWNYKIDLVFKLMLGVVIFSGFYRFLNKPNNFFGVMADLSFYIFFVHGYFIAIIKIGYQKFHFLPQGVIGLFLAFVIVLILSILSFYFLKLFLKGSTGTFLGAYR